jgi:hypothetical protein
MRRWACAVLLEHGCALGTKPALNTEESRARSCSGQWIQAQGLIDAVFAPNGRDAKQAVLRLGGNAWPFLPRHAANRCRPDLHPLVHERELHRSVSIKENHMSSIPNLTSASSALPSLSIHTHSHKKGSHVESADDSGSNSAAQAASGSVQNLFGRLLQSLEQVVGLQLSAAKPAATAATAATAAAATTGAGASATSSASAATASTQSASTVLQNYLNNLSPRADSSQIPKAAGSNVSVDA